MLKRSDLSPTIERRFHDKYVIDPCGCWFWLSATQKNQTGTDYPVIWNGKGKTIYAHRVSYVLHVGCIPDGLIVRHKCDHPMCVNPDHLEIGTHKDNARDRSERIINYSGENNPSAKLTNENATHIRTLYVECEFTYAELAKLYSVSKSAIGRIIRHEAFVDAK